MTRPREWMLFLPFLANNIIKAIDLGESILLGKSFFSSHANEPTEWDQIVLLLTATSLDLIEFIHTKTVSQDYKDFPV